MNLYFYLTYSCPSPSGYTIRRPLFSDHTRMHPLPNRRATVGAVLHPLRADAAHALMAARHGEVRLWIRHTNNACRLATDCGLRNDVPAGNVANISERQHRAAEVKPPP